MPSPFPGMDPYLESPERWSEVHNRLMVAIADDLSPKLRPRYRVRKGEGRTAYERKRQQVLASATHLVEIDLLRKGKPFPLGQVPLVTQYYILIARGNSRPQTDLYPFSLQETIPSFILPLDHGPEPLVNLQEIFAGVYDRAGFDLVIDYQKPLAPKLNDSDGAWVEQILK